MPPTIPAIRPPLIASPTARPLSPLELKTFSYQDRRIVLPTLAEALETAGCWLLQRQARSLTQIEIQLELQLRSAVDLYSALLGSGLELTRSSHLALTGLCTLRKYQRRQLEPFRVLEARLEITFLEDLDLSVSILPCAVAA